MINQFEEYFTRVTSGRYVNVHGYIGDAIRMADQMFAQNNNGVGILNRPDLYESYCNNVRTALRNMGAPIDLEQEVGTRMKEFIKLNFNVM